MIKTSSLLTLYTCLDTCPYPLRWSRAPCFDILSYPVIHLDILSTARKLMQVSRESRHEVLGARQLQMIVPEPKRSRVKIVGLGYFFVNWDLDLFFLSSDKCWRRLSRSGVRKVKNISLGLYRHWDVDSNGKPLVKFLYQSVRWQWRWFIESHVKRYQNQMVSVERIVIMIPHLWLMTEMQRDDPKEREKYIAWDRDHKKAFWDSEGVHMNELGLHTIDPTTPHYDNPDDSLRRSIKWLKNLSSQEWVSKMIHLAKSIALGSLRREVDCEMMIDYLGLLE